MDKRLRFIFGGIVISAALLDITTINQLQYSEDNSLKKKKIMSVLKLPFIDPRQGDLVLTKDDNLYKFKIVDTQPNNYVALNGFGMSMFVPTGFVMLKNPENGQKSLQCYGSIVGQHNFDVTWIWKSMNLI